MFDQGKGPAVVVVPGVQGRWEWMKPALVELAGRCHTISYSLRGDIGSGEKADPALGFDNYLGQLDAVLDRLGPAPVTLVRCLVRRFRRAPLCRRTSGTSQVTRARVGAGTRVEAEPAAGALDLAAVDIRPGVCRHRADASLAGGAGDVSELVVAPGILRAPGTAHGERADDPVADGGTRPARAAAGFRSRLRAHHRSNPRPHRRGTARPRGPGREHAAVLHSHRRRRIRCPRSAPATSAS